MAVEVKLKFMLKRFGGSPKDCDFMRKYSESITVYLKDSIQFGFQSFYNDCLPYSTNQ